MQSVGRRRRPAWRAQISNILFCLRNLPRAYRQGLFEVALRRPGAGAAEKRKAAIVAIAYLACGARPPFNPTPLFQTRWYLDQNPDVAAAGYNPLVHFLVRGAWEGCDPCPLLDVDWYLDRYPDVFAAGANPLVHYVQNGAKEGRDPHPLFDSDWYVAKNPEVAASGINPLVHYLTLGAIEGHDPNPDFDTDRYLRENPDVVAAGLNPLVHYSLYGQWEGRPASAKSVLDQPYFKSLQLDHPDTRAMLEEQRQATAKLAYRPLISVLMPVYDTPEAFLREAIESMLAQSYDRWELLAVDDGSSRPEVRRVLDEFAAREPRVTPHFLPRNVGIAAATNHGLANARGEFIALLDHDDTLHPQALFRVVELLQGEPGLDMIYSDEDKIDAKGRHYGPFFKPDWSPEYLLSMMYTCHLGVYRTAVVREIGGFDPAFDGAQDYDMVLRLVARTQKVGHVPWVLYHWRAWSQSTARSHTAKPEAELAARRALERYVGGIGRSGQVVEGPLPGHHRVIFALPSRPLVSIIIPTANGAITVDGKTVNHLDACLGSIFAKSTYDRIEIVVIHNGNLRPDQIASMRARSVVLLHYDKPRFNLAEKINIGAAAAKGEQLLILNDDTRVITGDWIEELLRFALLPGMGVVGCQLLFPTGRIQHCGVVLLHGLPGHPYYGAAGDTIGYGLMVKVARNFLAVTGACMMVPRPVWEMVGGYDTRYPRNYNDVDFCLRVRDKGFRTCYTPYAQLIHLEGVSIEGGRTVMDEEIRMFTAEWKGRYGNDPYYNRNLHQRFLYGVPPAA